MRVGSSESKGGRAIAVPLSDESCRAQHRSRPARNRRDRDRSTGTARGAHPDRCRRHLPQRSPFHGGQVPGSVSERARPRVSRRGRSGGFDGPLRRARRSCHHLPVGVLWSLFAVHRRPPVVVREQRHRTGSTTRRRTSAVTRWRDGQPVPPSLVVRGADVDPRTRVGEDRQRDATRQGGTHRVRRHDGPRCGLPHGEGCARRDGRGHRLRGHWPLGCSGCTNCGCEHDHRHRHGSVKARTRPGDGSHSRRGRKQSRCRPGSERDHRRRRPPCLRGSRDEGHRRAVIPDAAQGRTSHSDRHDSGRHADRDPRRGAAL